MSRSILYLIGYRGTGKTTVGRLLAERIGWHFVDADVELECTAGRTIREIFDDEGETGFRIRETDNLRRIARQTNAIVATGGGIILREENRALLKETGFVVWLTAPVDAIAARIAADPTTGERRPNLLFGGRAEIEELLEKRIPLYRTSADLEIDTADRSPEFVVDRILTQWTPSKSSG